VTVIGLGTNTPLCLAFSCFLYVATYHSVPAASTVVEPPKIPLPYAVRYGMIRKHW
jgi:hypothetical protein